MMDLHTRGNRVRKVTPEQRQEMRDRYRAGEQVKDIAARFDVVPSAVSYHCNGIDRPLQPCGTPAAYRRHQQAGRVTCDPCKAAWNAYCQSRKPCA